MKYQIVKPYLPSIEKYQYLVSDIFSRCYLTNNGPLIQQLEQRLAEHLEVKYLLLVANGTLALQVAYAALNISGKVLTTPFTFAATASSLCWQGMSPEFIDIDASTMNIDIGVVPLEVANAANAIIPVHVFGNPCQVDDIQQFAIRHQLKVIYDASHAFASKISGKSILSYGDAATLSFHATKMFHCIEGGAVIFNDKLAYEKAKKLINFGFDNNNHPEYIGINAKMSEFHAAMGLAVLDDINYITQQRRLLVIKYHENFAYVAGITLQKWHNESDCVGAYMPIILSSEAHVLMLIEQLSQVGIQSRRYFYPSLSEVEIYGKCGFTPKANDLSRRILCLPMHADLTIEDVDYICGVVTQALSSGVKE